MSTHEPTRLQAHVGTLGQVGTRVEPPSTGSWDGWCVVVRPGRRQAEVLAAGVLAFDVEDADDELPLEELPLEELEEESLDEDDDVVDVVLLLESRESVR